MPVWHSRSLNDDPHASWLDGLHQSVGDLLGEALLDWRAKNFPINYLYIINYYYYYTDLYYFYLWIYIISIFSRYYLYMEHLNEKPHTTKQRNACYLIFSET